MLYMLIAGSMLAIAAFCVGRTIGYIEGRTEGHLKMVEVLAARARGADDDARQA